MKDKQIKRAWESYKSKVVPRDATSRQIIETRRAFYAGANSLYAALMLLLTPGPSPTDGDIDLMSGLANELEEFNEQVKKGLA